MFLCLVGFFSFSFFLFFVPSCTIIWRGKKKEGEREGEGEREKERGGRDEREEIERA